MSRMTDKANIVNEMDEYICEHFNSEESDISDLSSIISEITKNIFLNLETTKSEKIHKHLMEKRLYAKMMLMSKARSGHDYYFPNEKKMCHLEETPYSFKNGEKCKEQYNEFIEKIWNPSFLKIEKMIENK